MKRIKARTLSGFLELSPKRQAQFDRMLALLRDSYQLYGFHNLDTPLMEASEVLLAKGGGETEQQIYRLTKGEADLALRFDLTVPLAKYVALHYNELAFPFRRYQIGKVYRGERAQRGRFREFYQADIDIIGDGSLDLLNEAEIPAIIYHCFTSLGLQRFVIRVNNRKILSGFYEILGLQGEAAEIMRIVDKLDKIGAEKVSALLLAAGIAEEAARQILNFSSGGRSNAEVLAYLEGFLGRSARFDEGYAELKALAQHLADFGVPQSHVALDLTIARGLDYYTGTVYETQLLDHPEIGSICSGGRYDDLAGYYTDKKLPGVGISIGLTRLFFVLEEQGYLNQNLPTAPCEVLVLPMTEDLSPAISLASGLRARGLRTQLYGERRKFKAKMSYADKLAVPFVAILGEEEIAEGSVTIKDMQSGAQERLPLEHAFAHLAETLASRPAEAPIREPQGAPKSNNQKD